MRNGSGACVVAVSEGFEPAHEWHATRLADGFLQPARTTHQHGADDGTRTRVLSLEG